MHRNSNTSRLELTNQNEINIVQASLLGSILANLLLILGMCFLIGGLRFREQVRRARANCCWVLMLADLQQHRYPDVRLSFEFERHELATTSMCCRSM